MSADLLLARLDHVRQTGPGRWIARCPAHEDRGPSLSIRELPDGTVLVHDFAGCEPQAVLDTVGLAFSDLYPRHSSHQDHGRKAERRPFPAEDVLRAVAHEAIIVTLAASDLAQGKPMNSEDRKRVSIAAGRLQHALEVAHVRFT